MSEVSAPYVLTEVAPEFRVKSHGQPESYLKTIRPKTRNASISTDLSQARELQRLSHKAAMAMEGMIERAPDDEARARAALAIKNVIAAWDLARDAARVARNKPLPGSLRPEAVVKKRKTQAVTFSEIEAPAKVAPASKVVSDSPVSPSGPIV